ncbi:HTH-type transcriptional regulator IolR [Bacillus sp. J14TS2]|uniref:DeoR/GlpR family DNA-binding transcription regulator n=1 Tax=Bacillus sp. J14TS2 TaxID=2807188 RepID=UPI001B00FE8E|nr:DeoR/GlpR family DNA-binding transcription regulator [Bacillus sp. J14TS2]GIN69592.1 HTH-type transcriptional regulator IolR [Bacillus sp. J14TS2]
MIKDQRINKIKAYVTEHKSVSLDELTNVFKVSKNTIRRDIQELVEKGYLKKVYGGVTVDDDKSAKLESFYDRQVRSQSEKEKIGKAAADYVKDGDIIFIDSGTTTIGMTEYIKEKEITVITNNLNFIIRALPYKNLNVITAGGILERKTNSFGSLKYMDVLNAYNINKSFMASTGVSLLNGVTNASPLESELKTSIVNRSSEVFLLVDHDKFDKYGLMTYSQLEDIDYVITDIMPSEVYQGYAKKYNIQLIIAE